MIKVRVPDVEEGSIDLNGVRVPVSDVSALSGYQWIERDILAGTTKKG